MNSKEMFGQNMEKLNCRLFSWKWRKVFFLKRVRKGLHFMKIIIL